jgi:hypothetical protein
MNKQILRSIYYDPKNGYPNLQALTRIVKEQGHNISHEEIKEFYESQQVNQIFKQNIKQKYEPIKSFYDDIGTLQVDLMDVSRWSRHNNGTNFLLNAVDIYSRYAWSFPLKNKQASTVKPELKKVYDDINKRYPNNKIIFEADNGSEFKGQVSKLNDDYDIKVILNNPDKLNQHTFMSIVERFNRTLLNKIKKHIYAQGHLNYVDDLHNFISAYNNTEHSTTKMKPGDIFQHHKRVPIIVSMKEEQEQKIDTGDFVRLVKKKKTFEKKGLTPNLSLEIYKVVEKVGNKFRIRNIKSSYPLQTLFIEREMVKIPDTTEIEDMDIVNQKIKQNDDLNKTVRDRQKENIGNVNKETGEIEPENWRLKPSEPKRKSKRPERYMP